MSVYCRQDIQEHVTANETNESQFRAVMARWREKFKVTADAIVDREYDKNKIKTNKELMKIYNNCVELEVRKAMVNVLGTSTQEKKNEARKAVDEMTVALGMQCSTLGYMHHHPSQKPSTSGSKGKNKMKAGAGGAGPKINAPRKVVKGLEALTRRW